jgi:N-acetylglucosamine-6-sulfatase
MTGRWASASVIGGIAAVAFAVLPAAPSLPTAPSDAISSGKSERPNIVVIYTDDQPVDTLASMHTVQRELVDRGVNFTDAHVPTSTCCPSRASLLTGLSTQETQVWTNWGRHGGFATFYQQGLERDTLATRLSSVGYRTALIGKYLNGYGSGRDREHVTGSDTYIPPGWDVWHAFAASAARPQDNDQAFFDYSMLHRTENGRAAFRHYGSTDFDYSTNVIARLAVDTIESTDESVPLFMLLTPYAPHRPYQTTGAYRDLAVSDPHSLPPGFADTTGKPPWIQRLPEVSPGSARQLRTKQIRSLAPLDDAVEAVIVTLAATNRLHNTLVVFMSDNGLTWGQFNLLGKKNYPYTTHVPLVMRWDAGPIPAGRADGRLVSVMDVAHTLMVAAGAHPFTRDSINVANSRATRPHLVVSAWRNRGDRSVMMPPYCGLRTSQWLYVRYRGGFEELYDTRSDRHLVHNLATASKQRQQLTELRRSTRTLCSPTPPNFTW